MPLGALPVPLDGRNSRPVTSLRVDRSDIVSVRDQRFMPLGGTPTDETCARLGSARRFYVGVTNYGRVGLPEPPMDGAALMLSA